MALKIVRVLTLPEEIQPNTIYLVRNPDDSALFDLYASDTEGLTIRHIATKKEIISSVVIYSPTAPDLPTPVPFWWNTTDGSLNIQYTVDEETIWVEAAPSILVPDFAGTGEANTMARSDHNHDTVYVSIAQKEW